MSNLSKKKKIRLRLQMRNIAFKILWKCSFNYTSVRQVKHGISWKAYSVYSAFTALFPPHLQPFWPQRKSHQIWQAMLMPSAIPFIEQESDCNYGNVRERECRGHHHCCQVAENSAKELYRGRQKYLLARNFVGRTAPQFRTNATEKILDNIFQLLLVFSGAAWTESQFLCVISMVLL